MINVVLPLGNNEWTASGIKLLFNQQIELKLSVNYEVYNYKVNVAECPCPVLWSTIKGCGTDCGAEHLKQRNGLF